MKRYYVSVTETLNKVVSVDAESEKEAVQKVQDAYDGCDIILDSGESCAEIRIIKYCAEPSVRELPKHEGSL